MKISIVNSICLKHDAISDSVIGTQRSIKDALGYDSTIYCFDCDYKDIDHRIVNNPIDLLFDDAFISSDLIIYHFGVYYNLFDSILLGLNAKKAVYYHNVTPAKHLPKSQHSLIARSFQQKANLDAADAIWAASRYNRDDLVEYGILEEKITVEPLFLKFGETPKEKPTRSGGPVELLFVGRFVESKGLTDLIDAVANARDKTSIPFRLTLAGNLNFSDAGYIAAMRRRIAEANLESMVVFEGRVSDSRLAELYARADLFVLPSYHEGFCVPVIEALQSRCVPLTYDAGNLSDLIQGWGISVPTGDKDAFSAALLHLIPQFNGGRPKRIDFMGRSIGWKAYDTGLEKYLRTYSYEAFASRIGEGVQRLMQQPAPAAP